MFNLVTADEMRSKAVLQLLTEQLLPVFVSDASQLENIANTSALLYRTARQFAVHIAKVAWFLLRYVLAFSVFIFP